VGLAHKLLGPTILEKKKDWKIGGNMGVRGAWLGEEGKEENGGV